LRKIQFLEERLRRVEADRDLRIEEEVRRRSHVFDVVLSTLPDLICTFDLRGRFTYANPALLGVWQKSLPEIIGKNTWDLGYPPDLAARIQGEVQRVIATKQAVVNHTPFTGANGETRVYEYIFSPVLANDRSMEEVTCTARDITDRQRMERALVASEEKLQEVFAEAPVAIAVFRGPELVVEMANPFFHAFAPELGQDVRDALGRVLETGEPFMASEWYVPYDQNGDGVSEEVWFNMVYHPMRNSCGKVDGVVVVCSDVSAQVRGRRELEQANQELEEFAHVASHDLQEPLRMVGIYTEMLLRRFLSGDVQAQEYARFVRQGVQRMEQLIQDLLAYSQVVHAENSAADDGDLNRSLTDAMKILEANISATNARVTAAALPHVRADKSQMAHVFQNVISNALKYRKADIAPEIDISVRRDGTHWVVSIRDNGIGFEPQYAQRIFGLFKRLHRDEYSGTGLGLAICQRIIERYGGRIWAEGQPGQGATFHFSLPEGAKL
jgi:PAS domain S-box-containing protein